MIFRVLVGISGGEDSLTLMHVLTELQRRSPFHFDVIGATVDLQFGTFKMDVQDGRSARLCRPKRLAIRDRFA